MWLLKPRKQKATLHAPQRLLSAFITSIQHLNIMQEINREKCVSRQLWQNPLLVIASLFIVMLKFRCFAFWNVNDINTQCCIRIGWDVFVFFFFSKAALQWAYLFSSPWGKLNNRYMQKSVALRRISKYWLFNLFLPPSTSWAGSVSQQ